MAQDYVIIDSPPSELTVVSHVTEDFPLAVRLNLRVFASRFEHLHCV